MKDAVKPAECMADIGCDHGYLSIALLQEGKAARMIACDIHKGPLAGAWENAKLYAVKDAMDIRQGDGLKPLKKGETNSGIIAGMGGPLALKILYEGRDILSDWQQLVLQIQSKTALVRFVLEKWGFKTEDERMTTEDGKYYTVMSILPPGEVFANLEIEDFEKMLKESEEELKKCPSDDICRYTYGDSLFRSKSSVLLSFLNKEEERLLSLAESLFENAGEERTAKRLDEVNAEIDVLMLAKWKLCGKA